MTLEFLSEFLQYVRQERKWWLVPLVLVLLLIGAFVTFSQSSALAPFFYPLV